MRSDQAARTARRPTLAAIVPPPKSPPRYLPRPTSPARSAPGSSPTGSARRVDPASRSAPPVPPTGFQHRTHILAHPLERTVLSSSVKFAIRMCYLSDEGTFLPFIKRLCHSPLLALALPLCTFHPNHGVEHARRGARIGTGGVDPMAAGYRPCAASQPLSSGRRPPAS